METAAEIAANDGTHASGIAPATAGEAAAARAPGEPTVPFGTLPPCPSPLRHPLRACGWVVTVTVGLVSLGLFTAILAAIPLVNFLALGLMLESEGRVVRSGRLRDGIPFAGALPRLGAIVVGTWLWLLVVRFVAQAAADAALVDPGGASVRGWAVARTVATLGVGVHLAGAWFAGGSFGAFFRPIRNLRRLARALGEGTAWDTARGAIRQAIDVIAPGRLLWLGLRGFVGALLWLFVPTVLFATLRDTTRPAQVLVTLVGACLLAVVLSWVPFLQARFAAEGRFAAFCDLATVREWWRRAPVVMLLAMVVLYGLSLPLFLFKVVAAPRDAVPFLTPIFVATIFPARLAVGWATHRAAARSARRSAFVRVPVAIAFVPLLALYLFLLFFTPAIDALGRRVLFDHHALLLPTPF